MAHFRMEIESLSENEEFARVVTAVFMSRMDPTLEQVEDVKTAVSEAVTNAVIHGYQNGEGMILLTGEIQGEWLTVTVEDRGTGIRDVKRAMEPLYTTDKTGERSGMGFSFMEAFMDQVQVESEPGKGTLVRMKKEIRKEKEPGAERELRQEKEFRKEKELWQEKEAGAERELRQEKEFRMEKAPAVGGWEAGSSGKWSEGISGMVETACTRETEVSQESGGIIRPAGAASAPEPGTASASVRSSRTARVIQSILSVCP